MSDIDTARRAAKEALLDAFSSWYKLPIGLYEYHDNELVGIFSKGAIEYFESHCRLIQGYPGGKAACEADQCNRARQAVLSRAEDLLLCHAGLYNQAVPIEVGNRIRAVLLFGEMRIEGETYERASLEKHWDAVRNLRLGDAESASLREQLDQTKRISTAQIAAIKANLPSIIKYFYILFDEEERLKRSADKVAHELQTRLQSVIAVSENLMMKAPALSREEIKDRTNEVLNAATALATVVNNLDEFTQEYRFEKQLIAPLLYESKRIYKAEADRHGVQIQISFDSGSGPLLEISRGHLQLALNNLIHNAIKYSFRDRVGNKRFVRITGSASDGYFHLEIENYGIGIMQEEIDQGLIFQDGYQGHLTEREYRTGAGKGLFFAKQVIDRHHGGIRVTSRLMAGESDPEGQPHLNQFTISLPLAQPKEELRNGKDNCVD